MNGGQLRFRHNAVNGLWLLVVVPVAARDSKAAPKRRNAVARWLCSAVPSGMALWQKPPCPSVPADGDQC